MTFFFRIVFLLFLLNGVQGVSAQQKSNSKDELYGSDPLLYNGKFYTFFPPPSTGGNQYFTDSQFDTGSVTIRGVNYSDLALNYDIYNQQLVLKYNNIIGTSHLLILSDAWLEAFTFKGRNFELISTIDTLKRICQVIGSGSIRILYFWKKDLKLDSFYGAKNHIFSNARKEMSMVTDNQYTLFWNNKSFYTMFGPEIRTAVKEYIRRNNINIKKANDQKMTEFISFCNTLDAK